MKTVKNPKVRDIRVFFRFLFHGWITDDVLPRFAMNSYIKAYFDDMFKYSPLWEN